MALAGDGALVTLEGADSLAAIARRNLERLGRSNVRVVIGRFEDTLAGVLRELGTLDYAFIDGHHDEKPRSPTSSAWRRSWRDRA